MCTERMSRSPRVRMEGSRQLELGTAVVRTRSGKENTHVFLRPECALLRLAAAAVKAQDELAALGLDGRRSQPKDYPLSGQRKTDMNLPNLK